jgi:predicted nucleotidyltransferase
VREIAADAGVDFKSAWTVVRQLEDLGLLQPDSAGKRRRLRWYRQHPAARYVEGLVSELGADGVLRHVREHLLGLEWLSHAVLYGSWARGTHRDASDVDLLLVGSASTERAHADVEVLERRLRRPVDFRLYSPSEFDRLRAEEDGFVPTVLLGPHLVIRRAS